MECVKGLHEMTPENTGARKRKGRADTRYCKKCASAGRKDRNARYYQGTKERTDPGVSIRKTLDQLDAIIPGEGDIVARAREVVLELRTKRLIG